MDLEDDSFADVSALPAFPSFAATGQNTYIGSPKRAARTPPNVGTPIAELRERANAVRAAMS